MHLYKENLQKIKEMWKSFTETGMIPSSLRKEIRDSWLRSVDKGIDPFNKELKLEVLGKEQLKERKELLKNAFPIIRDHMNNIYNFTKNTGYLVSFTDSEGYLLEVFGDERVVEEFKNRFNYYPGVKWDQQKTGTNSSCLAIKEKKPVQVVGAEHYCQLLHEWTCSAAPIEITSGEVIGVLNLSGLNFSAHTHTLGMVVTAAEAIKSQLDLKKLNQELKEKNRLEDAIIESISEGILFIDGDGIIKFMNKAGARTLKVDHKDVVGKHVTEIVDFKPVILDVLETGKGYVDKEFFLRSHGKLLHFVKTTTVLKDEAGKIKGVLDTFREIKRIQKMVNVMTGAQATFSFSDIIGESECIERSKQLAKLAAESDSNVLIEGETGTGKELFAQAIHRASSRREGPFLAINCAALPNRLIESELFGYVEGAFTGAKKGGRPGKFELANGGTIFLDEIGEMPINMQVKLLRVLQEQKIMRIGGSEFIPIDVRIIAATNKDLSKEVANNNFRHDLYYRLNVLNIYIPPLRERGNDIEILANHFLKVFSEKLNKKITGFTAEAINYYKKYHWPGNVRELENYVERLVNFCKTDWISRDAICRLQQNQTNNDTNDQQIQATVKKIIPLKEKERDYIKEVVAACNNNISRASRLLQVSRTTIYNQIDD